mmetsp:Transcript_117182/g.250404  ORF Transcript_117182/g.250404 Transcript_117182/m.250404 type:complete len:196 (-) Transcript_117182:84-671(-)
MGAVAPVCCWQNGGHGADTTTEDLNQAAILTTVEKEHNGGRIGVDDSSNDANRRQEKARLKLMVRSFSSSAVRGVRCSVVNLQSGSIELGEYSIDRDLGELTLGPVDGRNITFGIGSIADVFREQDLAPALRTPALSRVSEDKRSRMVVIQYLGDDKQSCLVALLEADRRACETFVTCLNILRLYAEAGHFEATG